MSEFLDRLTLVSSRFIRDVKYAARAINEIPLVRKVLGVITGGAAGGTVGYGASVTSGLSQTLYNTINDSDAPDWVAPSATVLATGVAISQGAVATAGAALFIQGWRQDAPQRAERQIHDRHDDIHSNLHRNHGLTPQQQAARAALMNDLRVDEDIAMGRARAAAGASNIAHNEKNNQRFVDHLITEASKNGSRKIDGVLFENPGDNGVKRGIFFSDDRFNTGAPATILTLSEASYNYAQRTAADKGVIFSIAPEGLLKAIDEATSDKLAIVSSPVFAASHNESRTIEKTYVDKIIQEAIPAGEVSGVLFEDKKSHGIKHGIILFGDPFESGKPNTVIPLTPASFRHAQASAESKVVKLPTESERPIRDILRQNGRTEDFTVHPLEAASPALASRSADDNDERKEQATSSASAIPAPRRSLKIATQHDERKEQPLSPIDLERGMAPSAPEPVEGKGWRKVVTEARGNNPRRTQWKPDEISITIHDDTSPSSSSPTSSSHLARLSSPRSTNGLERS